MSTFEAAPICAAIVNGKAAPTTLCTNAAGTLILILDHAAQHDVTAHLVGPKYIRIDGLLKGRWDETLR